MRKLNLVATSAAVLLSLLVGSIAAKAETRSGRVVVERLVSTVLKDNRIGIDPARSVHVYLPAGYERSRKSYPVVYYLHNMYWSPEQLFSENHAARLLDRAFAEGVAKEFIFVAADYRTPMNVNLFENSPINGRWLDFIVRELVPFVDARYRTLRDKDSRAITGDFFGGRGALRLAMGYPDLFGVVYALHPVATGIGDLPWGHVQIDWRKIHAAKSFADIQGDGRAEIFVAVSQAFLPNPNRPPFYCDFFMELKNGELELHVANTLRTQEGFLLDSTLEQHAENLRKLRAIGFEWGRFDPTHAHVIANAAFSRQLDDLKIEHEAEEYRGGVWERLWTADGRVYSRMLPFLDRHLAFASE